MNEVNDLTEIWDKHEEEYIQFDRVENKRSERPDLHAWLLLDELFPHPGRDMVCGAEHDEIYLDVSAGQIATLTEDQIIELTRCGVRYAEDYDCLAMFV